MRKHLLARLRHRLRPFLPKQIQALHPKRPEIPVPPAASPAPGAGYIHIRDQADLASLAPGYVRVAALPGFDAAAVKHRAVALELADESILVAAVPGYEHSDIARAVDGLAGERLHPQRAIIEPSLLLALSRGSITRANLSGPAGAGSDRANAAAATGTAGAGSANQAAFWSMVAWGAAHKASDLHIVLRMEARTSDVYCHINGRYIPSGKYSGLPTETLLQMVSVAWMDIKAAGDPTFDPKLFQQGALEQTIPGVGPLLLRWASTPCESGNSITLRLVPRGQEAHLSFADLGYLPSQIAALERAQLTHGGAVVFSGTPGSGKSRTLATLVGPLAATRKVMTLEDPVEYLIPGGHQVPIVRSLDEDEQNAYSAALRQLKRSAPDVVLLGEIRDQQSGLAFSDMAAAGIDIATTTHAASLAGIPDRLTGEFIGIRRDFLASPGILKLLMHQALLPKLCPHCRLPAGRLAEDGGPDSSGRARTPAQWSAWLDRLSRIYGIDARAMSIRNPDGCDRCRPGSLPPLFGYCGRTVVAEYAEPGQHPELLRLIAEGDTIRWLDAWRGTRTAPFDDPDMRGKTLVECAIWKAVAGDLDPRDIERFESVDAAAERAARALAEARR